MSSNALWDKAVEPMLKAMTLYGGELCVPGVAKICYEWEDDGVEREWVDIYGTQRPSDGGEYVIYRWADNAYGGCWWGVGCEVHLFTALKKFMEEVKTYDPAWSDYLS